MFDNLELRQPRSTPGLEFYNINRFTIPPPHQSNVVPSELLRQQKPNEPEWTIPLDFKPLYGSTNPCVVITTYQDEDDPKKDRVELSDNKNHLKTAHTWQLIRIENSHLEIRKDGVAVRIFTPDQLSSHGKDIPQGIVVLDNVVALTDFDPVTGTIQIFKSDGSEPIAIIPQKEPGKIIQKTPTPQVELPPGPRPLTPPMIKPLRPPRRSQPRPPTPPRITPQENNEPFGPDEPHSFTGVDFGSGDGDKDTQVRTGVLPPQPEIQPLPLIPTPPIPVEQIPIITIPEPDRRGPPEKIDSPEDEKKLGCLFAIAEIIRPGIKKVREKLTPKKEKKRYPWWLIPPALITLINTSQLQIPRDYLPLILHSDRGSTAPLPSSFTDSRTFLEPERIKMAPPAPVIEPRDFERIPDRPAPKLRPQTEVKNGGPWIDNFAQQDLAQQNAEQTLVNAGYHKGSEEFQRAMDRLVTAARVGIAINNPDLVKGNPHRFKPGVLKTLFPEETDFIMSSYLANPNDPMWQVFADTNLLYENDDPALWEKAKLEYQKLMERMKNTYYVDQKQGQSRSQVQQAQ